MRWSHGQGEYNVEIAVGSIPPLVLRARYAMSGTDEDYPATILRVCYAVCGTDVGCASPILRICYRRFAVLT
eukprot:3940127-Rhodomonas_salina.1